MSLSPDPWLMALGGLAAVLYAVALLTHGAAVAWAVRAVMAAWVVHALALVLDVFGTWQGARFGFATALSATVWLVIGAHLAERRSLPLAAARRLLAGAGCASTVLAMVFPGQMHAAVSPWTPLHWSLAIVSYGLLGAAVVHALLLDRAERRMRAGAAAKPLPTDASPTIPLMTLERLTFRFVDVGFIVLTVAIGLGAWFASQASSDFRWLQHKLVFAVAGWATFALLVVGRHARGWRGRRATRWVYVGALLLVLAYMGTRFVLEVLLRRG